LSAPARPLRARTEVETVTLDEIVESKRREAARLEGERRRLEERAAGAPPPRGFANALAAGDDVAVIAEFKRRSPSAGSLAEGAEPAAFARSYADGGAAALSVLTDGPYFGGDLDDLAGARAAVDVPVLRKDFVLGPVQVVEARAAGADAVLLIARILEDGRLEELLAAADALGMDALVEVHGRGELDRALAAGAEVVGVNARDLDSFEVDLSVAEELVGRVPDGRVAVAESGVTGRDDVVRLARAGADAVLVGGWLMDRGPDAVSELCGVGRARRRPEGAV
jgi:indole-3-glycerol phosphate synthase